MPPSDEVSSARLTVRQVNPLDDSAWDTQVSALAGATFFHSAAWFRVLHDTYGYQPICFTLGGSDGYQTILTLMEVDSWLTGRRGIGLPFTDECPPLGDAAGVSQLHTHTLEYARSRGWKHLEYRGGRTCFDQALASTSYFGHWLDLQGDETALFSRTDSSVRRAVRKAEQSNLTITVSRDINAVRDFYTLLGLTRKRHGLPAQPYRFFSAIQRHVFHRNHGLVVMARLGKIPVAGAVFFHFGDTVIYKFGASDETFQHLRANNLVMWEAIKWHAAHGFSHLDFGRTSLINAGLRKFKLGWGTTERTIDYVRYDFGRDGWTTAPDRVAGLHNRVFQILPVSVSRLVGTVLYKHVA